MEQRNLVAAAACPDYEPEHVRAALMEVIDAAGGLDWVRPGMRVGIKLNLCDAAAPEAAATTHPVMAAELTKLLTQRGASVVLGDSPGGPFVAAHINRLYSVCGMAAAEEAGGELNRCYTHSSVDFPEALTYKSFYLCDWLINCDAVINFCKLKSHGLMGITAAVKNLYGVIPGTVKSEYHFRHKEPLAFANGLVDLNEYMKCRLNLCDAVEIMEGNGPTKGTPRHMGLLLASRDPYALDRVNAALVGVKEEEILFLTAAKQRGLLSEEGLPPLHGDIEPFKITDFQRSGATSSWFVSGENDTLLEKVKKKGLALLLRSRPALGDGCIGCGRCAQLCPAKAITIKNKKAVIQRSKCVRCFCCQEFCPAGAMVVQRSFAAKLLEK